MNGGKFGGQLTYHEGTTGGGGTFDGPTAVESGGGGVACRDEKKTVKIPGIGEQGKQVTSVELRREFRK